MPTQYTVAGPPRTKRDYELASLVINAEYDLTQFVDRTEDAAAIEETEREIAEMKKELANLETEKAGGGRQAFRNAMIETHRGMVDYAEQSKATISDLEGQLEKYRKENADLRQIIQGANGKEPLDIEEMKLQAGDRGLKAILPEVASLKRQLSAAEHPKATLEKLRQCAKEVKMKESEFIQSATTDFVAILKEVGSITQLKSAVTNSKVLQPLIAASGDARSLFTNVDTLRREVDTLGGLQEIQRKLKEGTSLSAEIEGPGGLRKKAEALQDNWRKIQASVEFAGGIDRFIHFVKKLEKADLVLGENNLCWDDLLYVSVETVIPMITVAKGAARFGNFLKDLYDLNAFANPKHFIKEMKDLRALRDEVDGQNGLRMKASEAETLRLEAKGLKEKHINLESQLSGLGGMESVQNLQAQHDAFEEQMNVITRTVLRHLEKRADAMGSEYRTVSASFCAELEKGHFNVVSRYVAAIITKEENLRNMCNSYNQMMAKNLKTMKECDKALQDMENSREFWRNKCRDMVRRYCPGVLPSNE